MSWQAYLSLSFLWAQQPYSSIHEIESQHYRPYNHRTENQWPSPHSPPSPTLRTQNCNRTHQIIGYHPYWAGSAYNTYDYSLLSTVIFFSYETDPSTGSYTNPTVINTWRTTSLIPLAHSHGTEVQLCATLFGNSNLTNFLTNPSARLRLIDSLISLITQRNADGINIDFEGLPNAQKANFVSFMQQLRDTLNRRRPNAKLSVALPAVNWGGNYDVAALGAICDQLFIMGYDFFWSTAPTAGPTGILWTGSLWTSATSRCNSRGIVDYLAEGAPRNKLILGVPYYGFRYPTSTNTYPTSTTGGGVSRTYTTAKSEANTYGWNWEPHSASRYYMYQSGGQWYQTWWHDSLSLAWMYRTIRMQGIAGVGIWALSYDGSNSETWNALRDHFTTCYKVLCPDTLYDMNGPHGNYFNRENWTYTLAPPGAAQITAQFQSFQLENGYDTLFLYDGPTTTSPLIGHYTGTNSPGTITTSSGSLTFRFKSDGATVAPGWKATYTCLTDNTPPTTAISAPTWVGRDFTASFTDNDNNAIQERFWQALEWHTNQWRANPAHGFFNDNFDVGTTPHPDWTAAAGTWSVNSGYLSQNDQAQGNTNLYTPLSQDNSTPLLYHWKMRLSGTGTNRRGGLHIFADDPTQTQRGNSYLLWMRLDNQRIEIYKILGNTLNPPDYQISYPFAANTWYDIKALYKNGRIRIWVNNTLVADWTDPTPLTSGSYISLRTGNAHVDYDDLKVYKGRSATPTLVTVGPGQMLRYESPSSMQPACRLKSLVLDMANLWSTNATADVKIDLSPPTTTVDPLPTWMVNDISASFTDSDTRSGIAYRFYLPVSLNTVWQATTSKGFLYDDFDLLSWQSLTGTWSVSAGLLLQSDNAETNTNLYTPLTQNASTLYLFRTRTRLLNTTGNRRWGFHIFADDPTQTQRGNSYLIWLRADNNTLQIYETIANTLYTRLTAPLPFPLTTNTWYDIIVVYNNGTLTVYLNDTPIGSWTDTSPFPGSHLSLRTNQAQIEWDYFTVWQSRSATALIEVGPTSMAFTQNPNPTTPAFRLYSLVQDQVERFSAETYQETSVDWTPPSAPPQVRDSLGVVDQQYCYQPDRLWANWDASADPHSDIQTYEYAIGTAPGSTDVVSWTPINALSFTHTGLSLISGTTYYTTVRAKNHAGLYSNPSTSNGITFLGTPLSYTEPHALSSLTQIYPNPTFDEIVIQWTDTQKATCILYDLQGRALRQIIVRQGENRLSLGDVARGLYLLWVERDKTYLIQKL